MFDGLYFEYPKIFSFIVIFIACEAYCKMRGQALYYPQLKFLYSEIAPYGRLLQFLKWFSIVLLLFAMMSPVKEEQLVLSDQKYHEVVFVVSAQEKMARFKDLIADYVHQANHSSFALLTAGRTPWLHAPLTEDKKPFLMLLSQLQKSREGLSFEYVLTFNLVSQLFEHEVEGNKLVVLLHEKEVVSEAFSSGLEKLRQEGIVVYDIVFTEQRSETNTTGVDKKHHIVVSSVVELQKRWGEVLENENLLSTTYNYTFKKYYYFFPLFFAFITLLLYLFLRNKRARS